MSDTEKAAMSKIDSRLIEMLEEIKGWETDARISGMYANFPDPAPKP
jgi:hypothetical protein